MGLLPARSTPFLRAVQEDGPSELGCQGQDEHKPRLQAERLSYLRVTGDVDGILKRLPWSFTLRL